MNFKTAYCCWCSVECSSPLGLQDRSIPDSALTASSAEKQGLAGNARLNNSGAWVPTKERGAWFQVEFSNMTNITVIATQGDPNYDRWVKSYSVHHSFDGQYFLQYFKRVGNQRFDVNFKVVFMNFSNKTIFSTRNTMFAVTREARVILVPRALSLAGGSGRGKGPGNEDGRGLGEKTLIIENRMEGSGVTDE